MNKIQNEIKFEEINKKKKQKLNKKIVKYQNEISILKEKINNLTNENKLLERNIKKEEEKNLFLHSHKIINDKNDEKLTSEIKNYLKLN